MIKTRHALLLAFVWCVSAGASAPEEMRPVKITDGVYIFENNRGASNATVVMTQEGVVVFDFNILTADQVLAGLRKLTDKKVRYLISSHSALDHASGAWYFREDKPTYIATKNQVHDLQMQESVGFNERKESKDPRNAVYKGKELIKPDIGFDGNMTLFFGALAGIAILFLKQASEDFELAGYLIQVIISEFAPPNLGFPSNLFPLAFEYIFVHDLILLIL